MFTFYFVIFSFIFQPVLLVSYIYFVFGYCLVLFFSLYCLSDMFIFYFVIFFFSPYYWSDMFTVLVNMSTSMQICDDWNITDVSMQTISHDDVTPCPCSLDVALLDLTRFHIDPLCVETDFNFYECYQQPFSKLCFKQNLPS